MLCRRNFVVLVDAIESYTRSDTDEVKSGLKINLYYLIRKMVKIQKGTYLMNDCDEMAAELDKFQEVLSLNYNLVFSDATYNLNRRRQIKLRRPEELPSEDDVAKLKEYTIQQTEKLLQDKFRVWDPHAFAELRDLTVSRLTLFNARRGGEPARMSINEWQDAENSVWLDPARKEKMDDMELSLFSNMKLTYQGGKGNNHLVPILIPQDTLEAMKTLADKDVRGTSSVHEANQYMFAHTQLSASHVGGWHAVNRICVDAQVEHRDRLTATKMRHRVSTLYAATDVPEDERQFFYKHMGHSSSINANVYQAPLAESEILKVGRHLMRMDGAQNELVQRDSTSATGNASAETEELEDSEGTQVCDNSIILKNRTPTAVLSHCDAEPNEDEMPKVKGMGLVSKSMTVN